MDAGGMEWPLLFDVTADFVYCRLHVSEQLYANGYESEALEVWAKRTVMWSQGGELRDDECAHPKKAHKAARDVFVYFDNDAKVYAPCACAAGQDGSFSAHGTATEAMMALQM